MVSAGPPTSTETFVRMAFASAISPMKASSMAPTLKARAMPSEAPRAAASRALASRFSFGMRTFSPLVSGLPISGITILAQTRAAGADITDWAIRWPAMSGKKLWSMPT